MALVFARVAPLSSASLLIHLLSLVSLFETDCLRISSIGIPAAISNGSQLTLSCNYELAPHEQLYSVKWYRNYVEFYRFQADQESSPVGQGRATATPRSGVTHEPRQQHQEASSKTEFELDGIHLDLAKSNGTHVHLKRATLATEATYKCEVSADSPTFATISAERQLRVYVLPKQKLTIVDNSPPPPAAHAFGQLQASSPANGAQSSQAEANLAAPQQPPASKPAQNSLVYTLNDHINLTCLAGPSKPAAKLTWLINDLPVSGSSRWLSGHQWPAASGSSERANTLTESRLTLAFKLQPNYLFRNGTSTSIFPGQPFRPTPANWHYPIRLRCIAKLVVDYTSETSILVSGGKTMIKRRNQRQPAHSSGSSSPPVASSLVEPAPLAQPLDADPTTRDHSKSQHQNNLEPGQPESSPVADHYPVYRWPRPNHRQASANQPLSSHSADHSADNVEQYHVVASRQQHQLMIGRRQQQQPFGRQNVVVVWTGSQLRAQTEHIEQMLRKSHPNEIEQPIIGAKTEFESSDNDALFDEFSPGPELGDQAHPSTAAAEDPRPTDEEYDHHSDPKTSTATSSFDKNQHSTRSKSLIKDYELNESVIFTCNAQINQPEQEQIRSVHLKWLINDKELNSSKINSFDGSEFFYQSSSPMDELTSRRYNREQHQPENSIESKMSSPSYAPTKMPPTGLDDHLFEHQMIRLNESYSESREGLLTIELTPSLFQLKELNLKCRTIVEQPLIEYESQLIASVAMSPFIRVEELNDHQAANRVHYNGPSMASNRSSAFNRHRPNTNNATKSRPNKNNVFRLRQQHPSSGSSSLFTSIDGHTDSILRLCLIASAALSSSLVLAHNSIIVIM